jgi:hypothetical protein
MQLPPTTSHFSQRVRFGRYVARRLKRAKRDALADDAARATQALKTAGRAVEDAEEPIQDAYADRDASDDELDGVAKEAHTQLGGRSRDAIKSEPFTLIFGDGLGYYTAASASDEETRYGELAARARQHLPAKDPVRVLVDRGVAAGVRAFKDALTALGSAQTQASLAETELERATDAWTRQMEKTYGLLLADVGKAEAERFFPRLRSGRKGGVAATPAPATGNGKTQ